MFRFVTFEGGEGAGKSTLIKNLCKHLDNNKIAYKSVREPGGLEVCEKIRDIVKYSPEPICTPAELLLFSASRAQLVNNFLLPALKNGELILCDRFFDSTRVYQGYANNIDDKTVMQITRFATQGLEPTVTFFLDIDPQVAFLRKGGRDKGDRIEAKNLEYHNKVRQGYLHIARSDKRFVVLDATKPEQELVDIVVKKLIEEKIL